MSRAIDDLNAEYQAKAKREGFLDLGDASEALDATRDYELRGWLNRFIARHNATEALDDCRFGPRGCDAEIMARALLQIAAQNNAAGHIACEALKRLKAARP